MRSAMVLLMCLGCTESVEKSPPPVQITTSTTSTTSTTAVDCTVDPDAIPDGVGDLICPEDFELLAAETPQGVSPSAHVVMTVIDRDDAESLHFVHSSLYIVPWEYAFSNLGAAGGMAPVSDLGTFNLVEYSSPERRFVLGAVVYYEAAGVWAYEVARFDVADAAMVESAYRNVAEHAFFGSELQFHAGWWADDLVSQLPDDIPVVRTEDLLEGITYQPVVLGTAMGKLTYRPAEAMVDFYSAEVVVTDQRPTDPRGVGAATLVTDFAYPDYGYGQGLLDWQPLLGAPGLGDSLDSLMGEWVQVDIDADGFSVTEVTEEQALAWWEEHYSGL